MTSGSEGGQGPCQWCDEPGYFKINGRIACELHIVDAFAALGLIVNRVRRAVEDIHLPDPPDE